MNQLELEIEFQRQKNLTFMTYLMSNEEFALHKLNSPENLLLRKEYQRGYEKGFRAGQFDFVGD